MLRRLRGDLGDDRCGRGPAGQRLHPGPQTGRGYVVSAGELGVVEETGVRQGGVEEGVDRSSPWDAPSQTP